MHVLLAGKFTASLQTQLREILFELGAREILEARNSDEAFAAVKVVDFDLIVADLHLPVCNGIDSLPEWRRRGRLRVPVVVIVTFADPIQLVRAKKLGVRRCHSRPVSLDGLRATIDAALNTPLPCATVAAGEF
jgi:CheY-like chemotaxis protein